MIVLLTSSSLPGVAYFEICSLEAVIYNFCCYVLSGKYEYCQGDVREMSGNFEEACCYEPCSLSCPEVMFPVPQKV